MGPRTSDERRTNELDSADTTMTDEKEIREAVMLALLQKDVGTLQYYRNIFDSLCFRSKYIIGLCELTIKVSSDKAVNEIRDLIGIIGTVGIKYNVEKLGMFECWFPRRQMKG